MDKRCTICCIAGADMRCRLWALSKNIESWISPGTVLKFHWMTFDRNTHHFICTQVFCELLKIYSDDAEADVWLYPSHQFGGLLSCTDWHTSSWWLQMTWHQIGARPSATTILSWCLPQDITMAHYRQVSNISHTKSQHINGSRLVLQLSLPNPLKPGVKSRMKM